MNQAQTQAQQTRQATWQPVRSTNPFVASVRTLAMALLVDRALAG